MSFSLVFGSSENLAGMVHAVSSESLMSLAPAEAYSEAREAGQAIVAASASEPAAASSAGLWPEARSHPVQIPAIGALSPTVDGFLELLGKTRREAKAGSRLPSEEQLTGRRGRDRARCRESRERMQAALPAFEESAEQLDRSRSISPPERSIPPQWRGGAWPGPAHFGLHVTGGAELGLPGFGHERPGSGEAPP